MVNMPSNRILPEFQDLLHFLQIGARRKSPSVISTPGEPEQMKSGWPHRIDLLFIPFLGYHKNMKHREYRSIWEKRKRDEKKKRIEPLGSLGSFGVTSSYGRAQRRVAHSNGWKTRHGKSQSHVAWMAGGRGNASF